MAKRKPFVEIRGTLTCDGHKPKPYPGIGVFQVSEGDGVQNRTLMIDADLLPKVLTKRHVDGDIRIRIYEKKIEAGPHESDPAKMRRKQKPPKNETEVPDGGTIVTE